MRKLTNIELNRPNLKEFKSLKKSNIIIVLDNIRSAHNVGSIFRSSDAFKVQKILTVGITATPPNNDIRKTALGAEQSVDWAISKNISEDLIKLKEIGYEIISVEQTNNSISLENFTPKKNKIVLIFGNEIKGISQEIIDITDTAVEIKQYGTKHSFNVSVTSAICLWEISKSLEGF